MTLMIEPVFMRATRQGANFIVVLIALVVIFKTQLTSLVGEIFEKITNEATGI